MSLSRCNGSILAPWLNELFHCLVTVQFTSKSARSSQGFLLTIENLQFLICVLEFSRSRIRVAYIDTGLEAGRPRHRDFWCRLGDKVLFYFFKYQTWPWSHPGSHLMGSGMSSSGDEAGGT